MGIGRNKNFKRTKKKAASATPALKHQYGLSCAHLCGKRAEGFQPGQRRTKWTMGAIVIREQAAADWPDEQDSAGSRPAAHKSACIGVNPAAGSALAAKREALRSSTPAGSAHYRERRSSTGHDRAFAPLRAACPQIARHSQSSFDVRPECPAQ